MELEPLVEASHPLVKLGRQINGTVFAERLGPTYAAANGAPGVDTRLLLGALSLPDNPDDGHTLDQQLAQVRRRLGAKAPPAPDAQVDLGDRGHHYAGPEIVPVEQRRRGATAQTLWREVKRRAAVEPTLGHLKSEHRLERNRLKGAVGDAINAILSAATMNFQQLQGGFGHFGLRGLDLL